MLNELVNIVTIGYHVIIKVTKENILNTNTSTTDVKDINIVTVFSFVANTYVIFDNCKC